MNKIGIRHEDKYALERRVPLVPDDIKTIIKDHYLKISVEPSEKRIFSDEEFEKAGAGISTLDDSDIIIGVKEMPENIFKPDKTYIFFSHVIKGQPYNMPMLRSLMSAGSTLIDYEKITDPKGRRLIFFGKYAGLAGMINTLWATGVRYEKLGIPNPFSSLKQAYHYNSLEEAKSEIRQIGQTIYYNGLPPGMQPFVIAVTGDGNVSQGALEILELIPSKHISISDLKLGSIPHNEPIITVNILPRDYLADKNGKSFVLQHYIDQPEDYESVIEELLPEINVFVNGIYWDDRYPKLIKKRWLKEKNDENKLRLQVIGDITCDVHGSVECTEKATEIEDPVFVYNPSNDNYEMGFDGDGVAVMAVDILPSELPREASEHFSSALRPFIPSLAKADFSADFDQLSLPDEIKRAVIVHRGKLTPDFKYLEEFV
jgi:saccharopine dehydrogenase (NAD+, L-lysine forming)